MALGNPRLGGHSPTHTSSATGLWFYATTLVYVLLFSCCGVGAALVVIDDFNPRVQYNTPVLPEATCRFKPGTKPCDGKWWSEHDDSRGSYENHTVHTTYGPGTTATLEFTGTSVALYGIVLQALGAHGLVTLDGARSSFDCNTTGLPDGTLLTKQQLFSRTGLDPSVPHTIVVAYDDSTFVASQYAWLGIDYFEIDEQPLVAETSITAAPQGVTSGSSATLLNASGLPSTSPAADTPEGSSLRPTTGTIVGGVLGGLAALLLGVFVLIMLVIRRRQNDRLSDASPSSQQFLTPYAFSPARERPATTSYAPSSFSDDSYSSLVTTVLPPYSPAEDATTVLFPAGSAKL